MSKLIHGHARRFNGKHIHTPLYYVWLNMNQRCNNPNRHDYKWYGGKGIIVCERWRTFSAFLEDMGEGWKHGLTIERIDVTGNYCPENCRWETWKVQHRNRTNAKILTWNGKTQLATDWAKELGIPPSTISVRMSRGWPTEKVLSKP